ncbi:hypothetical protein [Methylobacterium nigriterrae]|uniref:hypothetical protein n=1 Tax=Methylobacterium nigriterrae TaxID=3127512 RepID=UPI003013AF52
MLIPAALFAAFSLLLIIWGGLLAERPRTNAEQAAGDLAVLVGACFALTATALALATIMGDF